MRNPILRAVSVLFETPRRAKEAKRGLRKAAPPNSQYVLGNPPRRRVTNTLTLRVVGALGLEPRTR